MNPKIFIGRFPEIADLDQAEQARLLEEARYEAFVGLKLAKDATLYLLLCVFLAFTLSVIPPLLLGFSISLQLICLVIGFGLSFTLYQRLYRGLLAQGLAKVLAQRKQSEA
ncbi:hypothetical protein H2508_04370 [Parahaliea sp. F7430]|uniref:Uncharacterized protein n=1 Tax=Sediminihaliea albiluteola TaxID=2758564 RepID=A0A7W2YIP9_9GAMM|nr:hypothetical protein [Sediminihaliea albiluteola]MBA6412340.1 hypothetical protein [Sediminihaliea albiluteola]